MEEQNYSQNNTYEVYQQEGRQINTQQLGYQQQGYNKKPKKSGTGKRVLTTLLCAIIFGVIAGGSALGIYFGGKAIWDKDDSGTKKQENTEQVANNDSNDNNESKVDEDQTIIASTDAIINVPVNNNMYVTDVSGVAASCMPSVVSIVNSYTTQYSYFGQIYEEKSQASGSGIIIGQSEEELLLVTNYHVIANTDELTVTFIDGKTAEAYVKGFDEAVDIAVISIPLNTLETSTKESIAIAVLGDSDTLQVGEPAIAIGNALGYGQSVTLGVISALNRELAMDDNVTHTLVQTDAAINPGNSGGALLNIDGEVIGINSNKIGGTTVEGMGYAIPISMVKDLIDELSLKDTLMKVEEGEEGYLGIYGQDVTEQAASMYDAHVGVYVYSVSEGSAAEKAGLQRGDIIVSLDENEINDMSDLTNILHYYAAGTTVDLKVYRKVSGIYNEITVPITLGKKTE